MYVIYVVHENWRFAATQYDWHWTRGMCNGTCAKKYLEVSISYNKNTSKSSIKNQLHHFEIENKKLNTIFVIKCIKVVTASFIKLSYFLILFVDTYTLLVIYIKTIIDCIHDYQICDLERPIKSWFRKVRFSTQSGNAI